jgi:murein DD-endopeptidase MepM/ murein hydrolase activator NlpD
MTRKFSIIVVPLDGGRTIEKRLSLAALRLLVAAAAILLTAGLAIVGLALRVHIRNADYRSLRTRNAALVAQVAKLNELRGELERLRQDDQRIRSMLGFDQEPGRLSLESLYRSLADSSGQLRETLPPAAARGDQPLVPSIAPLTSYTVSRTLSADHAGIDLVAENGTPVAATADGKVAAVGWDTIYGNYVRVQHRQGFETFYGHLQRITRLAGDSVRQGDAIGLLGNTGRSTAPHLHYAVSRDRKPLPPERYFR